MWEHRRDASPNLVRNGVRVGLGMRVVNDRVVFLEKVRKQPDKLKPEGRKGLTT